MDKAFNLDYIVLTSQSDSYRKTSQKWR